MLTSVEGATDDLVMIGLRGPNEVTEILVVVTPKSVSVVKISLRDDQGDYSYFSVSTWGSC
jgi:hypothetical protein